MDLQTWAVLAVLLPANPSIGDCYTIGPGKEAILIFHGGMSEPLPPNETINIEFKSRFLASLTMGSR